MLKEKITQSCVNCGHYNGAHALDDRCPEGDTSFKSLPELKDEVSTIKAERDRLRAALEKLKDKARSFNFECQNYMGTKEERLGHYCGNCQPCDLSDLFDELEALAGGEA